MIFRALTEPEIEMLVRARRTRSDAGYFVERVIDKKEFDRAKKSLQFVELG